MISKSEKMSEKKQTPSAGVPIPARPTSENNQGRCESTSSLLPDRIDQRVDEQVEHNRRQTLNRVHAPTELPRHAGQVERRQSSTAHGNMVEDPIQSTIARERDPASQLHPSIDPNCPRSRYHFMGDFCHVCRGIQMPWGTELPRVTDDNGEEVRRGPVRSLLQGVNVRNSNAIGTLSVRAWLNLTGHSTMSVDGFNGFEARYVAAAAAGCAVARLVNSLVALGTNPEHLPRFYDIIHEALWTPDLSYETIRNNLIRRIEAAEAEAARPHGHDNIDRGRRGEGLGGIGVRRQSSESESDPSPRNRRRTTGPSGSSSLNEDLSGELIYTQMPDIRGTKANRPARRGDWEFVAGTDLDDAVLGQPDPSKFFLVRQNASNQSEKDIRQYPALADMDWNDPEHIASLNRARRQIRNRTSGKIAEARLPWTQKEKDILKHLLQDAINKGQKRTTINWEAIAAGLSQHLEGVVQKEGEPIAKCTKVVGGVEVPPRSKKDLKLKTERVGSQHRTARAIQNQSEKYGDIWLMLEATQPRQAGKRKKRETQRKVKQEAKSSEDDKKATDDADSDNDLKSKRPRRFKDPKDEPDRGPKNPPGPPPPPGGAGGLAGPMGKSYCLAPARTTIPTH
jgi:hypothetical protein